MFKNPPKALTSGILGARAALLELAGDVFDGRQRAKNVNSFTRRVDVDLQFSSVCAHPNVLLMIDNLNEVGIWILFQYFDDGMKNWHRFARFTGDVVHLRTRDEVHGHGDGRSWNPEINVGTSGAAFVDLKPDQAFMEGKGAGEYECAAKSESCLRG